MSESFSSRSVTLRIAKRILTVAGLVFGIWIGVLLWWQSSLRQVSSEDVLIYLVALPAAALAGFACIHWLRSSNLKDKVSPPPIAMPGSASVEDGVAAADTSSNALPVLAAWGITCVGSRLNDFHSALVEKKHRPQPDACLQDDYGYPIHAARVHELDTSMVESDLQRILETNPKLASNHIDSGRDGFLRALTLVKLLIDQLSSEWPLIDNPTEAADAHQGVATLRGIEPKNTQMDSRLHLQLKLIIPADFTPAEQQLASAYFLEQAAALPVNNENMHLQMVQASDEPTALLLAEQFRTEVLHAAQPQALLVIACDSGLCPAIIERWQMDDRLFSNRAPQGLMPGEAAFAIVCVNDKALSLAVGTPACELHRVVHARRNEPAGSTRKSEHATLDAVVSSAIEAAGLSNEELGAIACDADHRSNRILECIGTMLAHTPHLDAIEDRLSTNEICGHTGAASSAGGWTAGIAHVIETGRPVLLFNVSHALERAATVLLPAADRSRAS